jgi:hypothetical protein
MNHPDTSFLAVYIFGQYLWTVAPPLSASQEAELAFEAVSNDGTHLLTFDLALASLAISVKVCCSAH